MTSDAAARIERTERAIRDAGPGPSTERFLATVPSGYLAWIDPPEAMGHVALVVPTPEAAEGRSTSGPGSLPGTARLAVGSVDRPGLLASIAGALSVAGLSIVTAEVFTTTDGVALDVFEVRSLFEQDATEIPRERWSRFDAALRDAVTGALDLRAAVGAMRSHYPNRRARVRASVRVDEEVSRASTVLEVEGPDRPGLLFELCAALADARLDVHSARVATYGARIVDVFYVRETDGSLPSAERLAEVRRSLVAVVRRA